jgi:hypothetical protein
MTVDARFDDLPLAPDERSHERKAIRALAIFELRALVQTLKPAAGLHRVW